MSEPLALEPIDEENLEALAAEAVEFKKKKRAQKKAANNPVMGSEPADLPAINKGQTLVQYCRQIMPNISSKGFPLGTHQNLKILLDTVDVTLRYNVMKKETEIIIPGALFTTDNYYNASAAWILSTMRQIEMQTGNYMDMLELLADSYVYNPVEEWITRRPWDGVSRLQELFDTITPTYPDDQIAIQAFISKWMLGTIESMCNPKGADMPGILVLQGPQEIGKTWWVRKMCPSDPISGVEDAVRVGVSIEPNNKDSVEQCVGHWIVEFGELDGVFRKSDIAALKAFLTRPDDTFRKSFARRKSRYPRRTSFIASVNERNFLVDETGNRRFWTIACRVVDSWHNIDMQQLWAEMYHKRVIDNMPFTLNDAEKQMLKDINDRHQVIEPTRETLATKYDWDSDSSFWRYMTATQIAIELGFSRPEAKDVRKVANFVRKMNGGLEKRQGGKDLIAIPSRITEFSQDNY